MAEHADPFEPPVDPMLAAWAAAQRPPLSRYPHAAARVAHAALHDELASIDADLEVLCARRRAAVTGLTRLRPRLWPGVLQNHRRRRGEVDEIPMPPIPPGAVPVGGTDLREVCLGLLRRHGTCSLRELHGLLHRYGYRIDSDRPVQRLADALAYEVSKDRCRRVERGVYAAVGDVVDAGGGDREGRAAALPTHPLRWSDPDPDHPQVDPVVIDDPERWSAGTWPAPGDAGVDIEPARQGRYPDSTLDEEVLLARTRAAALATWSAPPPADDPQTAPPAPATDPAPLDPDSPRGERFVDESLPMVRRWAAMRRLWWERQRQMGHEGSQRRVDDGGDDDSDDWDDHRVEGGPGG